METETSKKHQIQRQVLRSEMMKSQPEVYVIYRIFHISDRS